MSSDYLEALRLIEKEKEIPFEELLKLVEEALAGIYKKTASLDVDGSSLRVRVQVHEKGVCVYSFKEVVNYVDNSYHQIKLEEARKYDDTASLGDYVEVEVTPANFGRIVAQTAKQVLVQKIRETEKDNLLKEYNDLIGDLTNGTVSRREGTTVYVDLGKVEAVLPPMEQVPTEKYKVSERIKVYILEVKAKPNSRNADVIVSRSHPSLIRRLFELEVPEIEDKIVRIISVAREAGQRTKIAVLSNDENIDPMGACVGHHGARVQSIVNELYGERIDIVKFNEDPAVYISEALSPAKPSSVEVNEEEKSALVKVPSGQLSLAIGKSGQNARLAAKLTGWKIDIKSDDFTPEE